MNLISLCSVLPSPSKTALSMRSFFTQLPPPCAVLPTRRSAPFTSGSKTLIPAKPLETRSLKRGALEESRTGEPDVDEPAQGAEEALVCGSPIVIVEAPPILKTAEPMPMMRPNRGLIKPGDPGRVLDRRPKDVWAVRFAVGAYLIDRKYFKPYKLKE